MTGTILNVRCFCSMATDFMVIDSNRTVVPDIASQIEKRHESMTYFPVNSFVPQEVQIRLVTLGLKVPLFSLTESSQTGLFCKFH